MPFFWSESKQKDNKILQTGTHANSNTESNSEPIKILEVLLFIIVKGNQSNK